MDALIALLMISCLASHALGQDELRGPQDKLRSDGGPRGTIYSQRQVHLSPHRMMHFGKRPVIPEPPVIVTPQDLERAQQQIEGSKYPYLLYLELERGKTLRALPDELPVRERLDADGPNMMYSFDRPELKYYSYGSDNNNYNSELNAQQVVVADRPLEGQRFLKLINAPDGSTSGEAAEQADGGERAQSSTNSQDDSSQPQQAISISSRSIAGVNGGRSNTPNLPKAYVSSLFARQGSSSLPSFGLFNKKAEPKENFFMHFGRK